jgi:diguanylate cyclase (GGDEF)-like protein
MGSGRLDVRPLLPQTAGTGEPAGRIARGRWPGRVTVVVVVAWLALMGAAGWVLATSQSNSRKAVAVRLQSRTQFAAGFISIYGRNMLRRVQAQAATWFATERVDPGTVQRVASGLGLPAAELFDARGNVIGRGSSQSSALSLSLLRRYAALGATGGWTRAGAFSIGVSEIAGMRLLVFAVSFQSPAGVRVFTGALDVSDTMLPLVLENLLSTSGWQAYVVDANGGLLGAVHSDNPNAGTLAQAAPSLWAADKLAPAGAYSTPQGSHHYVTAAIPFTTWRIVVTDPDSQLYGMLTGPSGWLAWLALGGLTAAGLAVIVLITGLQRGRRRLTAVNQELARLAAIDALTGLKNRRAIEDSLYDALSHARRHEQPLSLLVLDVDHFKHVNDTLGHRSGDAILTHAANVLNNALRAEDSIGRWGGEEFLVVLPGTDELGALHATERLRAALADDQPERASSQGLPVTITIGVAEWNGEPMDELVSRADSALYLGKAAGRDNVQVSTALPAVADASELA